MDCCAGSDSKKSILTRQLGETVNYGLNMKKSKNGIPPVFGLFALIAAFGIYGVVYLKDEKKTVRVKCVLYHGIIV